MSRNSKNARLTKEAKDRNRTKGFTGPAKTTPKHGKKNAWWQKFPTYNAFINGRKAPAGRTAGTAASTDVEQDAAA